MLGFSSSRYLAAPVMRLRMLSEARFGKIQLHTRREAFKYRINIIIQIDYRFHIHIINNLTTLNILNCGAKLQRPTHNLENISNLYCFCNLLFNIATILTLTSLSKAIKKLKIKDNIEHKNPVRKRENHPCG